MTSSLSEQAAAVPDYIVERWPELAGRTRRDLASYLEASDPLLFCGSGDSHHAALSMAAAASNWLSRPVHAANSLDAARYVIPYLPPGAAVVGISASGHTARSLEAVELARRRGCSTLAITANHDSPLAQAAERQLFTHLPEVPFGPGLVSYIGSLLAGYAAGAALAPAEVRSELDRAVQHLARELPEWMERETEAAEGAAEDSSDREPALFIGAGPLSGSARFAAAKAVEAVGQPAWGQDLEEWAHLEYFCEPADQLTWLLSAGGRSASRELEIELAAQAIGRRLITSRWTGIESWIREDIAPLMLWAGPAAYADHLMLRLGHTPFRDFGGGRSAEDGGGASRIRSSERLGSELDLQDSRPPK